MRFFVVLFVALISTTAHAGIVDCPYDRMGCKYSWDFETGSRPPNNGFDNSFLERSQFQIYSGGAFDGNRFGRVTVSAGEHGMVGRNSEITERAEIMTDRIKSLTGEVHFGVVVRFGPDFNPHDDRTLIHQIKPVFERGFKNSPQFAIYANDSFDRWKVCNNIRDLDECDYQQGQVFRENVWHRIVVSQKMSKGDDGWLKFYVDGKLIYHHVGPTKYNRKEIFTDFRVGIYRNNVEQDQSIDVDNFILSRDLEAVADFLKLDVSKLR